MWKPQSLIRLKDDRNALLGVQIGLRRVNEQRNVTFSANLKRKRGRLSYDFIFYCLQRRVGRN